MGVPYGNGSNNNGTREWKSTIVNSVTVYEPTTDGADINTQGNITASGDITGANIPAWAVTATHNFLDQSITESTPLITAGLATPGSENYVSSYLLSDHGISLPKAGSTSHFVSPNQPIFTFTRPTLVHMIIPITTATGPLASAGWLYIPYTTSYLNPWLPGDPLPTLNSTGQYAADDVFSGLITNLGPDYLYGRVFPAGTHNLDPTALAPLAFYLFEEKSFDYQVFTNTTNIATNTGLLSATAGVATGRKALIVHPKGFITSLPQFYQTQNGYNNGLNDLPFNNYNDLTYGPPYTPPGTISQASKLNNNGLARLAADWKQYTSWVNPANNAQVKNSDPDTFENVSNYGVKVKQSGYYKVTCHMQFKSSVADTAVAIRFALNTLVDDANDPLNYYENPSPCQVSDVICQGDKTAGSVCLSHVIQLAADDEVSVYTSGAGVFGEVKTSPSTCVFRVEYMGPAI